MVQLRDIYWWCTRVLMAHTGCIQIDVCVYVPLFVSVWSWMFVENHHSCINKSVQCLTLCKQQTKNNHPQKNLKKTGKKEEIKGIRKSVVTILVAKVGQVESLCKHKDNLKHEQTHRSIRKARANLQMYA